MIRYRFFDLSSETTSVSDDTLTTFRFHISLMITIALALLALLSGCSTLFGTVKPVDEKSSQYHAPELSAAEPVKLSTPKNHWKRGWKKIETSPKSEGEENDEIRSDLAYQSVKTGSIISVNSACRESNGAIKKKSLKTFTRELLMGFSEITLDEERPMEIDHTPALQTTLRGRLNDESVMIRAIVLVRGNCVYDLMYLSSPQAFQKNEADFHSFVEEFRLK
jgi:hypothetical protein